MRSVLDEKAGQLPAAPARFGKPAANGGVTFQPASFAAADGGSPLEFLLHDFVANLPGGPPAALRLAFEEQYDAAWVRARLPRVFDYTPEFVEESESALLDLGFVAAGAVDDELIEFACADRHGRAGLRFAQGDPRPGAVRRQVAELFWSLLLAKPEDLADFEQMVYHEPNDVWLKIGCLHGKLFCEPSED